MHSLPSDPWAIQACFFSQTQQFCMTKAPATLNKYLPNSSNTNIILNPEAFRFNPRGLIVRSAFSRLDGCLPHPSFHEKLLSLSSRAELISSQTWSFLVESRENGAQLLIILNLTQRLRNITTKNESYGTTAAETTQQNMLRILFSFHSSFVFSENQLNHVIACKQSLLKEKMK